MPLIYVGVGILLMLFFLMVVKLDAFWSILITTFAVGLLNGMNVMDILDSVLNGIGGTMGKIILILTFGAMLGKLIEESGAAHTLTYRLTEIFGLKNIQYFSNLRRQYKHCAAYWTGSGNSGLLNRRDITFEVFQETECKTTCRIARGEAFRKIGIARPWDQYFYHAHSRFADAFWRHCRSCFWNSSRQNGIACKGYEPD